MCCFPVDGSWLKIPSCQRPPASLPAASDTCRRQAAPALKWSQQEAAANESLQIHWIVEESLPARPQG